VDSSAEGSVAPVCQGRDHQAGRVAEILIVVAQNRIGDPDAYCAVLPVVPELRKPGELGSIRDVAVHQLLLDDVSRVHIQHDQGFKGASLESGDVGPHHSYRLVQLNKGVSIQKREKTQAVLRTWLDSVITGQQELILRMLNHLVNSSALARHFRETSLKMLFLHHV
jgi:hypothetical protein